MRVFDEIEKIAENSSIRLEGHSRPIPMLKIDMVPLSEEKESKEKIRLYIEDCISQISKDIKAEVKHEEIQKKMSRFMSTKELLNELSELSKAKVLIMDNPFGPISSEHLLKPLFQIAKKYNTQLICFTDLKQNSILNCFDLIYMIKIRTNIMGTSEFIEIEKQLQPDRDLKIDESL